MSPEDIQIRADLCAACATPCALRADSVAHADPCAACPLRPPAWSTYDCTPGSGPGDRLAAEIERRVLTPAEAHAPAIVAAVRKCGGCTQAKHALGSEQPHPDPGVVV